MKTRPDSIPCLYQRWEPLTEMASHQGQGMLMLENWQIFTKKHWFVCAEGKIQCLVQENGFSRSYGSTSINKPTKIWLLTESTCEDLKNNSYGQ